jgi:hypothetical protein
VMCTATVPQRKEAPPTPRWPTCSHPPAWAPTDFRVTRRPMKRTETTSG